MKSVEAGQRYRLPSGNVVEVRRRADSEQWRCRYVRVSPHPDFGDGMEFGDETTLEEYFLLDAGLLLGNEGAQGV